MTKHASDCATNNGPALPAGPCDCGVVELPFERRMAEAICAKLATEGRLNMNRHRESMAKLIGEFIDDEFKKLHHAGKAAQVWEILMSEQQDDPLPDPPDDDRYSPVDEAGFAQSTADLARQVHENARKALSGYIPINYKGAAEAVDLRTQGARAEDDLVTLVRQDGDKFWLCTMHISKMDHCRLPDGRVLHNGRLWEVAPR